MDPIHEILDAEEPVEGWSRDPKWWRNLLVISCFLPIAAGASGDLMERYVGSDLLLFGVLILLLMLTIGLSGQFLAQSPFRAISGPVVLIPLIQIFFMFLLMINFAVIFDNWLAGGTISGWELLWPEFDRIEEVFFTLTVCSMYAAWVVFAVRLHRHLGWVAYLLFALLYTCLIIWLVIFEEIFGTI